MCRATLGREPQWPDQYWPKARPYRPRKRNTVLMPPRPHQTGGLPAVTNGPPRRSVIAPGSVNSDNVACGARPSGMWNGVTASRSPAVQAGWFQVKGNNATRRTLNTGENLVRFTPALNPAAWPRSVPFRSVKPINIGLDAAARDGYETE